MVASAESRGGQGRSLGGDSHSGDKQVTLLPTQSPASLSKAMSPHSLIPAGPPTLFASASMGEGS